MLGQATGAVFGTITEGLQETIRAVTQGSRGMRLFGEAANFAIGAMNGMVQGAAGLRAAIDNTVLGVFQELSGYFTGLIANAIDFDLSITGLLQQAERTRKYFSELADEMNFFSSSTGNTSQAMGILLRSTGKSAAGINTLKSAFITMVDSGADSKKFIEDMLPLIGDFEVKTGVGAQQFGTMAAKFQQMFGEKKGITKDIQDLQKALIGTGLKGAQLEQTMQGLTEAADKLAFATQGSTLNIKQLSQAYSQTTAVFKAFGINTQTTSNFLNGLIDPENIEKNMLLMNKMGISYQEFNDMLNSGQGQDKFFDKILNNVGKVAQEANLIQDASTRYKYLKDTLGLPPEIANKLMKVTPNRMQAELRKIKREMQEAEKKEKWRKELKAREEKYEEAMMFLRMQMVQPLVAIINKNRGSIMRIMQALTPVFQRISTYLAGALESFANWLDNISGDIKAFADGKMDLSTLINKTVSSFIQTFGDELKKLTQDSQFKEIMDQMMMGLVGSAGNALKTYAKDIIPSTTDITNSIIKMIDPGSGEISAASSMSDMLSMGQTVQNITIGAFEIGAQKMYDASQRWLKLKTLDIKKESKNIGYDNFYEDFKKANVDMGESTKTILKEIDKNIQSDDKTSLITNINKLQTDLFKNIEKEKDPKKQLEKIKNLENYMDNLEMKIYGVKSRGQYNAFTQNNVPKSNLPAADQAALNALKNNPGLIPAELSNKTTPLTTAEIQNVVQKLSGDQNFMATVSGSLMTAKDKQIKDLTSVIETMKTRQEQLEKEVNSVKAESITGILMGWADQLFGPQDDSIKSLLISIDDSMASEGKVTKKPGSASTGVNNTLDMQKFKDISKQSSTTQGVFTTTSNLIAGASATGIKNLQVRQTLFLKSIAEATYDSALYLKYIGNNLIFGPRGLVVENNTTRDFGKRYNLSGLRSGETEINKSYSSGFQIVAAPSPS